MFSYNLGDLINSLNSFAADFNFVALSGTVEPGGWGPRPPLFRRKLLIMELI